MISFDAHSVYKVSHEKKYQRSAVLGENRERGNEFEYFKFASQDLDSILKIDQEYNYFNYFVGERPILLDSYYE